ncbi:uncharacterized protein LOC144545709 [Carex rostrata]
MRRCWSSEQDMHRPSVPPRHPLPVGLIFFIRSSDDLSLFFFLRNCNTERERERGNGEDRNGGERRWHGSETIVNPPVNALSFDVLISLNKHYEEALRRDDVKVIVLTGANGRFCGGFDVNAFQSPTSAKEDLKVIPSEFITYCMEALKVNKGGKKHILST